MREPRLLNDVFPSAKPIVGMVHLLPLPGAPRWAGSMDAVAERALADAAVLEQAGLHGLIVENYLDAPFYPDAVPQETIAALAVVVRDIVRAVGIPVGVNVLRNDAAAALAVAAVTGARFIRVNVHTGAMLTDQGWISGRAHETIRLRERLSPATAILADVLVKHAVPLPGTDAAQAAQDAWHRGLADGLIVSGTATGTEVDLDRVRAVKAAVPEAPVWIGSGVTAATLRRSLAGADGVIVGSWLARGGVAGSGVDPDRTREFMEAARGSGP